MADKKKRKKRLEGLAKALEEAAKIEKDLDRRDVLEDGERLNRLADSVQNRPPGAAERPAVDHPLLAQQARAALIIAAMRRSILTYRELGSAIDLQDAALATHVGPVLDLVSDECAARKEPSLAALVVNSKSGEPGAGYAPGSATPWHGEVQRAFRHWAK